MSDLKKAVYPYPYKIISAKNDAVFKKLFVDNPHLLKRFISDILDIPMKDIKKIKILNPELPPRRAWDKMCRLDIVVEAGDKKFNIEMQTVRDEDFADRVIYYWAVLFTSKVVKGTAYSDISKTISINILGYKQFDCDDYHSKFTVFDNKHNEQLTDKLEIHFFELPKLEKEINPKNYRELWLHLINANSKEEFDMLRKANNSFINTGIDKILGMSANTRFSEYVRQRNKWEHDYYAGINKAMNKGIKKGKDIGKAEGKAEGIIEGRAEGIDKERKTIVSAMKRQGLDDELINRIINDR